MKGNPSHRSGSQFAFTCLMMISVFSTTTVHAAHSWESPSFKIERKVNLEAIVSCGEGMLQGKYDSMCRLSANEDTQGLSTPDCSACDPRSKMHLRIDNVLVADNKTEWRSLAKTKDSMLQEINITINFPQVFKVRRISVKAGLTPLSALWMLEESHDVKSDFKAIRYYAADQDDCSNFSVPVCVLKSNRSWEESVNVDVLASRVRLRFLKMWSDFDFYSVSEISIEGQCECNGKAECWVTDDGLMACHCINNTCGVKCETCCHGYVLNDSGDCAEVEGTSNNTAQPLQANLSAPASTEHVTDLELLKNATKPYNPDHFLEKPASVSTSKKRSSSMVTTVIANIITPSPITIASKSLEQSSKAVESILVESTRQPSQTTTSSDVGDFLEIEVNRSDSSSEDSPHLSVSRDNNVENASQLSSAERDSFSIVATNTTLNATTKDTNVKRTIISSIPELSTSESVTEQSFASSATMTSAHENAATERNSFATVDIMSDEEATEEIIIATHTLTESNAKKNALNPAKLSSTSATSVKPHTSSESNAKENASKPFKPSKNASGKPNTSSEYHAEDNTSEPASTAAANVKLRTASEYHAKENTSKPAKPTSTAAAGANPNTSSENHSKKNTSKPTKPTSAAAAGAKPNTSSEYNAIGNISKPTKPSNTVAASIRLLVTTKEITAQPATNQTTNSTKTTSHRASEEITTTKESATEKKVTTEGNAEQKLRYKSATAEITSATITTTLPVTEETVLRKATIKPQTSKDQITPELFNKQTTTTYVTTDKYPTRRASLPSSSSSSSSSSFSSSESPSSFSSTATRTNDTTVLKRTKYLNSPTTVTVTTTADKENNTREPTTEKPLDREKTTTNKYHTPSTTASLSVAEQSTSPVTINQETNTAMESNPTVNSTGITTQDRFDHGISPKSITTATATISKETTSTQETSAMTTTDLSPTKLSSSMDETLTKHSTISQKTKDGQTEESSSDSFSTKKTSSSQAATNYSEVEQTLTTVASKETTNNETTLGPTRKGTTTVDTTSVTEHASAKKNDSSAIPKAATATTTKATVKESLASMTNQVDVTTEPAIVSTTVKPTARSLFGKTTATTSPSIKTSTRLNPLESTVLPPIAEEHSTALSTGVKTTTLPTVVETGTESKITKKTTKSSNLKTITAPFHSLRDISTAHTSPETTTRPPLVNITTKFSIMETTNASVETTAETFPPLDKTTTVPTTVKTTSVSTKTDINVIPEETTTEPFPPLVDISIPPTTMEITTTRATVQTTSSSPAKTTTESSSPLVEITTVPTTVKTFTVSSTVEEATTEPQETTTEPFPPLLDISTPPSILKITTKPNIVQTSESPEKTTTEPFPPLLEITAMPTTVESTTGPTTLHMTTKTIETTVEPFPPLVKRATESSAVKRATEPTSGKATIEPFPALVETTLPPAKFKTTTEPTTVITTPEQTTVITTIGPTTPEELTEEQARILFGNLPKGVCYCVKFATVDRRCFPKALHKPCICRSNFAGVRCEKCAPGHFNYPFCAPCRCNKLGSANLMCDIETGRCTCKPGVRGRKCDACPLGSFNFPTCSACECNPSGSYGNVCDPYNGQCPCRYGARGRQCNKCPAGYYNFPYCQWCGCNPLTTTENICEDFSGGYRCLCKSNFKGHFCGECKRGHYDFPLCKKCACSPRGYGSCNELGNCVCDAGYAGSQCDRCANGYYGFPSCRACNCNTFGSFTTQCNYTTGQCACRPNIRGNQCNRCVKGMVGFPKCVECDCNPDGTRFLPGKTESMCYGTTEYKCLCKANVAGKICDRCRHGYYNFNGSNPSGCSPCTCSSHGTISGTRRCHAQYGYCDCKNHVIGGKCDKCRNGYYALKSHHLLGCKACKCDPGGSVNMNCFKHSGDCSCVTGVRGKKCDSLFSSRPLYFPTLYQMSVELERAVLTTNSRVWVPIGADENRFPSFSGTGYAIFPAYKPYYVTINIPKTRLYRIIFHYALKENLHASARVDLAPRGSKISNHTFEVQFSPPKPGAQQTKNLTTTVNRRGLIREFDMKKGAWNIIITSHSSMLLLDYIVFLPEDYYKAELLKDVSSEPCLLRTSKPEHCDMYTYYEPKSPSIITVSGDKAYTLPLKGNPDIFIDPRFDLRDQRLSNMALLGNIQPSIGFDISVPESGHYVIMVTYLHPERFTQRAFVRVGYERGHLEILPCKYQFACRQFAMDDNKKPKSFELTASPDKHELKLESSVSSKIAVISITVIPLAKWNIQYIQPTFQCRMYNKSCVSTTYDIPPDAIQLAAFSRRIQDKMITILTGAVRPKTIYYVIVYYQQPQSLSTRVEQILIADQVKSNISVTFQYCPARSGCRIVLGEEDGRRFQFSKGVFTATIEHDRRTQVGHILLVPQGSYSTRLLEPQSIDRVQQFIQSCGKDHFHIDPGQAGRMCREGVFTLTIGFNRQPLQCKCSLLGSRSVFCEKFGGQCLCRANVVGRRCDRCRLGHSGFPRCRSCGCHEIGSVSPTCTSSGRCRCKPGFGGYKCDRCRSSGYYGFPDCKPCACNSLGSLSMFCRSRDGQCQCRRKFQGQKCNECRIGFYDFPRCKACGCNPAGIKLLPGQTNGCGSVNNTHCVCKNNVAGDDCDSCKPFTFNLQMKNPLGCQSCDCNANGTLGSIKTCHATIGQCECKSHVTGRQCGRCKEGYHSFKGSDVFGCKRCLCNAGGSVSQSCNAVTGACTCLHGIGGTQCDRVASQEYYYPTLYHHKVELEDGFTGNDAAANFRHSESEFTGFSWRGYVVFTQSQNFIYIMIDVPRTTKYQLIFHYNYISYLPVTAMVKFIPTLDSASFPDGPAREQTLDVQFRSTSSWIFAVPKILLVRDYRWEPRRVMLSQGKWKLTMAVTASDLFVDYLVLLPEEYYSPRNLELKVTKPCTLSRDEKYCVHYTYPTLKKEGIVTIQAEDSSVVGGIRRSQRVGDVPFQGRLLSGSRNVMSVRLPSTVRGQFVLLASYFYNSDDERRLSVVVRTGDEIFRAQMSILSCRYRFGCRQVAIDSNHGAYMFTAKPDEITTVSLTSNFMVALDFISAIPLSMWNEKLLIPAEQCVDNGFSCIQTSYPDPSDATKIEVEDRSTGGDIAPYYIMDRRARLKHVKVGKKTVFIHGTARSGRYYVIVHFYQPNFLTFPGKVIISGQNAATTLFTFHHCPHVSGCRAIGTSQYREGISESIYIGRQNNIILSITIPEDKGLWIDYVMLVPLSSFSPSLLEIEPIDVNRDFIQDCGQNDFFLKESSSNFCLTSTFTITSKFNNGALPCQCDRLGSAKTGCRAFGGQCSCRPNVIGRACDRCKSGYSGFPLCRKPIT